ncbi:radical SAM domain-containing protein [Candidatus Magnetoovum chiemensis]|nr:radical SAM domain-containing protein [Candidatus Magnetoovum chiemensis]
MSILLIYPPFGAIESPYISIPTLAAYLRSKNIEADALDLNLSFFKNLLSLDNIESAKQYALKRFTELNDKDSLGFIDAVEYFRLFFALNGFKQCDTVFHEAQANNDTSRLFNNVDFIKAAVRLACTPYFPEGLEYIDAHRILTYLSKYKKFSTRDIIESQRSSGGILSDILEPLIKTALSAKHYDIVGISAGFPDQIQAGAYIARLVKAIDATVHVTIGGAFVSCHIRNINDARLFDFIDSFVLDDGEIPLERLYSELRSKTPQKEKVPALIYISDGQVKKNPPTNPLPLNSLPAPSYDVFPIDDYLLPRKKMPIPFRLSRGCYWCKCTFCRTNLSLINNYDAMDAQKIADNIKNVIEQTGSRFFNFTDDSSSPLLLDELSKKLIEQKVAISWSTNLRFDAKLTIERCMLYREAGCYFVNMGLEAYNDRILRLMKKGTNIELIDRILSNMSWAGLRVSVYVIVGFPTETEQEAIDTFNNIKRLQKEGQISMFRYHTFNIVPYSDVYNNPRNYGITKIYTPEGQDLDAPIYHFDCEGLSRGRALQLENIFNSSINKTDSNPLVEANSLKSLTLNGREIVVNYEIPMIYKRIEEALKVVGEGKSFHEWLIGGSVMLDTPLYPRGYQ